MGAVLADNTHGVRMLLKSNWGCVQTCFSKVFRSNILTGKPFGLGLSTLLPSAQVKRAMNPLTQAQLADTVLTYQIEFKQHEVVPKTKIVSRKVPVSVDDNTQAEIVGRHIYGKLSERILAENYNVSRSSVHRFINCFRDSPSKLETAMEPISPERHRRSVSSYPDWVAFVVRHLEKEFTAEQRIRGKRLVVQKWQPVVLHALAIHSGTCCPGHRLFGLCATQVCFLMK